MKQQTALAEGISTIVGFAHACSVQSSDGLLRDNVVVVVAAAVLLSLGDLILWTPGTFEMFAGGLPAQLLTFTGALRMVWKCNLPPAVVQLTALLWGDSPVVTGICADLGTGLDLGTWELLLNNAVDAGVFN